MTKSHFKLADSAATRLPDEDAKIVDHLADSLIELAQIAESRDLAFLAYLIEMAATEARAEAIRQIGRDR